MELDLSSHFRSSMALCHLSTTERDELASCMHPLEVPANRKVVTFANDDRDAYLILSGRLKVCRVDAQGKETIFGYMTSGEWFGELALLEGSRRSADVIAISPCILAVLPYSTFVDRASKLSGFLLTLLHSLGGRLIRASEHITLLCGGDVKQRILKTLESMGRPHPEAPTRILTITPRPTHRELGNLIGASREVVTRNLAILESAGHLLIQDDSIYLKLHENEIS